MKKIITLGTPKEYTFTCDNCNSVYSSDEYDIVTIPASKDIPEQTRYHDKCPNCKKKVVAEPR